MTPSDPNALPVRMKGGLASAARSTSRLLARAADSMLNDGPVAEGRSTVGEGTPAAEAPPEALLAGRVDALRASFDGRLVDLTRSVEGLRELVQSLTAADLAHQHQLVQIDDRLARVTSVDDLRQLSDHWLRQKGIVKVVEPDVQSHWKVSGGTWDDRDRLETVRPAYLAPGAGGSSVVLQYGELAPGPVPGTASETPPAELTSSQPVTTDPEATAR